MCCRDQLSFVKQPDVLMKRSTCREGGFGGWWCGRDEMYLRLGELESTHKVLMSHNGNEQGTMAV